MIMKTTSKKKTNRQFEKEQQQGKLPYRVRALEEQETEHIINEYMHCSCLDAAYERMAIDQGLVSEPVFHENKIYMKQKQRV